jgi:hypothetical protein
VPVCRSRPLILDTRRREITEAVRRNDQRLERAGHIVPLIRKQHFAATDQLATIMVARFGARHCARASSRALS